MRRCLTTGYVSYKSRLKAPNSGFDTTADQENTDADNNDVTRADHEKFKRGTCVIIAPSTSNLSLEVNEEKEAAWEFFSIVE